MDFLLAQMQQPGGIETFIDNLARTPLSKVLFFVGVCTCLRLAFFPFLTKTAPHQRHGLYTFARIFNEFLDAIIYAGVVVFLVIRPFGIQAFRIPSGSMLDTLLINDFIVANKAVYRYSSPKHKDIVVFRPPARACTDDQIDSDGQPKVDFIKRCIGTPGDLIEIKAGTLYRNGRPANEPYRKGSNATDWKLVRYEGGYQAWKGQYIPCVTDFDGQPNFQVDGIAKPFAIGNVKDGIHDAGQPWVHMWKTFGELSDEERARIDELSRAPAAKIPAGWYLMMGDNREGSFDGRGWGLVPERDIIGRSEFIWLPFNRWSRTR